MTDAVGVADPRVPGYLGRVLDGGVPVGTCFQVAPRVLVTAWHVLDDIGAAAESAAVRIDPLAGGAAFDAAVARLDSLRDLAVLTSAAGLPAVAGPLWATDQVPLRATVTVTGHAVPDDPGRTYRFLNAPGEWAGGTTRDEVPLGRMTSSAVVPGMSGGPVVSDSDGAVAGVVSGRYNTVDGWLAGTVWVARTEDLAVLLDGIAEVTVEHRPLAGPVAGRPLDEVGDPFALEVHRPVQPENQVPGLPVLPAYVPRDHDTELGSVVRAAEAESRSGIAVLVGGSSTGKTRACWEALALLRDRPEPWRLWHPIDPTRPDAALRELPAIGRRTVVWLNEAQLYLDVADGGLGEQVAAGLRALLRDPVRAPVLVLATLWPQFWDVLTARPPPDSADPRAEARQLLAGHDIAVPAAFTAPQLQQLNQAGDARLAQAAAAAQDGQVIQFLAGVPELLARYRNAPPAAAALIHTAMDARRLGAGIALPRAFLEAAAPGYLTDDEWDAQDDDWLEQGLAYTAKPAKGVRGPLTRIRPRPARPGAIGPGARDSDEQPTSIPASTQGGPLYRLADYLDQHGRTHRKGQIPPAGFWAAAADYAFPADQAELGHAAHDRGLYRAAAQLHKNAARQGTLNAIAYLTGTFLSGSPLNFSPPCLSADVRPLRWAAAHAPLDNPDDVRTLLVRLREAGADEQAAALAERAVAHAPLDDPKRVARLLDSLQEAGADEQARALGERAAAHIALDDPVGVAFLLDSLREAGADEQVLALAERVAAAHPDDPGAVAFLLDSLQEAGKDEQARALGERAAAHIALDDPDAVAFLLDSLREAGADQQVTTLLRRDPAAHAALDNQYAVAALLDSLQEAGAYEQVTALLRRDPHAARAVALLLGRLRKAGADEQARALAERAAAHAALDDPAAVTELLRSLRKAGAGKQAAALLRRDPAAHAALDDPRAVTGLLRSLRKAGAGKQVAALAERAAAHAPLDNPRAVALLLRSLRKAGAGKQAAALLRRDPAAHAPLDDPRAVAALLGSLREAGADEQARALAERAAAHAALDNQYAVAALLGSLRKAGADEQARALAERAAAHPPLDDPGVANLVDSLWEAGADEQAWALLRRHPGVVEFFLFVLRDRGEDEQYLALAEWAAAHVALDDPVGVARLLDSLREAGADEQARALAERAAAHAPLDDPDAMAALLDSLREAGADEQVTALLRRDPAAHAALDNPGDVGGLLDSLREAGADEQVTALLRRDPAAHAALDNPGDVGGLLGSLREAGADEQAAALLARDPAAHVALDNPDAMAALLGSLREAGADEQARALAERAAAHAPLDDPDAMAALLDILRDAGTYEQATALAERLPRVGMFELFREHGDRNDQFRYGREADGSPATPWDWEDLD